MKARTKYIKKFDANLIRFFRRALLKSSFNLKSALFLFKTCIDQNRAIKKRARWSEQGIQVPPLMIVSITNRCNLRCAGCYSRVLHPETEQELDDNRLFSLVSEADDLGISVILIAGGEPLLRPVFFEIARSHPHLLFLVFTNSLLINETNIGQFSQIPNLIPILSLEGKQLETDLRRGSGVFGTVLGKMALLKAKNLFFGTSLTLTSQNFDLITSKEFQINLNRNGSRVSILVDYVPIEPGTEKLALTQDQKKRQPELMRKLIDTLPGLFVALPGDEEQYGGCLAAGRGFIHINPLGQLEPCPFAPFSDTNLTQLSLKEALGSELLRKIRQNANQLSETRGGCALWENRQWVINQISESKG